MTIRTITATTYITPLREGGSVPAIIKADDGEQYAMKFRGAGQGHRALIAEIIVAKLALALELPVPEPVLVDFDPLIARSERDPEIQDILKASPGINMALGYISGAVAFNPLIEPYPQSQLASRIVWLDAFVTNVDRTARNVNMLLRDGKLWLIDHGASLYFHHSWQNYLQKAASPFPMISQHVLLPFATELEAADAWCRQKLTSGVVEEAIAAVPNDWLGDESTFADITAHRQGYVDYLTTRLEHADLFVEEAKNAG